MWGRVAHEMGLTLDRAIADITGCGCAARLVPHVVATWERARAESLHREA